MPYRIAGIDVHKKMLAVVVADVEVDGDLHFARQKVGTTPADLRGLAEWPVSRTSRKSSWISHRAGWRPVFEAHRWTANLRILEIDEIKTVPHVPLSHPFVERLIGTIRREFLDHGLFWNVS